MTHEKCRSCGAPVFWLRHEKTGRLAPIDSVPVHGGNVRADFEARTYAVIGKLQEAAGQPLHTSHYATCPEAAAWRRRPA